MCAADRGEPLQNPETVPPGRNERQLELVEKMTDVPKE